MFRAKLVCLLFLVSVTITTAFVGEVVDYEPFTPEDGVDLTQGPELLEIAAKAGSRIRVPLTREYQIAAVQGLVDVHIDCQPWFDMFNASGMGAEVTWLRDISGDFEHEVPFTTDDNPGNRVSVDERWYNITRTILVQGAEDSDNGTYTCRVCIFGDDCFEAELLLFLVGSQPFLDVATDNEPEDFSTPDRPVYKIGADFCLERGQAVAVTLECPVLFGSVDDQRPIAYPNPDRTWSKDGTEIYTAAAGELPTINMEFVMQNPIFLPGLVNPAALDMGFGGNVELNTLAHNFSLSPNFIPEGVTEENLMDVVFNNLLGVYSCEVANVFGNDTAVSVISECAGPTTTESPADGATECPEVPGNIYFQLNGVTYPSGSSILITEVGEFSSATGPFNPDSSLICMTSEVNSQCCRDRDGGNVGEWYFPDGSLVPRRRDDRNGDFTRNGYTQQVRLSRRNNAFSPSGVFTCSVPREDGCEGQMHMGTISLELPIPSSVMTFCAVTVWRPPEGRFDLLSGYEVRFFIEGSGEITFRKEVSQFFHITTGDIRALGQDEDILVQVRVLAEDFVGPWTEAVPLCP